MLSNLGTIQKIWSCMREEIKNTKAELSKITASLLLVRA